MRVLTHSQYEELRRYEDGHAHYMFHPPSRSLTVNGLLSRAPNSGHDRASSAFAITDAGLASLTAYRERWKVPA